MAVKKSQKVQNSLLANKAVVNPVVNPTRKKSLPTPQQRMPRKHHRLSSGSASATNAPQGSTNTIDPKDEEIARLKAENTQLRHASAASNDKEVTVPRPTSDDDKERFNTIRRSVKRLVDRAGLDVLVAWHEQPKEVIVNICLLAKAEQPYLKRFSHNWATEEMIKRLMKNRREYLQRMARMGGPSVEDATNNPDDINEEDQNEDSNNGNGDNSTD
ncbi:hypothetical protein JOM56_013287 [Amanita muscaria]